MELQRITLIGSGRVATQLGLQLHRMGKKIVQVYSRHLPHAQILASQVAATPVDDLSALHGATDIFIIAVADDAIGAVTKKLSAGDKVVVHTSGSTPMSALEGFATNYGVFYPLQTFTKAKAVDFTKIPFCIEASGDTVQQALFALAGELSQDVHYIDSRQRLALHTAAVFVSNFVNYMYLMGEEILHSANLPFHLLGPLIAETAGKISHMLPQQAQTGPALRNDAITINKHLELLAGSPDKQTLYRLLSQSIAAHFQDEKK
jgi:predicted short-subunit dehydrogenase-like oxidoreductase (DUF2520 family)